MSLDDSQEEDCTVYIEQLKSDNASLKLNAATKISVIASVLGHNRIRDELIPYIVQIIEQMDNDNDFLIKVSEGLLELKSFCTNNKEVSILIHPLKILASLDQPSVRDKAISCLKKLAEQQDKAFYEQYYFPLVQKLSENKTVYSPRVVAACLIPITYPNVNQKKQEELRKMFKKLALQQNSPLVRRALAENIEAFKAVVSKNIVRSDLLEIWQSLIVDPIDIIRIKALECAHFVASAFKVQQTNDKFFKFIRQVDPNKKSWRIRYSLAECLANMIHKFDKETIKKDVLQCFQELLKDQEPEVRAIALLKAPTLAQKLSKQQSYTALFQYFEKASKDGSKDNAPTVKLALVESIIPFFKTIENQKITENGIPILASLIKDENLLVRINIVQSIPQLHTVIGKQNTLKYLIPMLETVLNDKKWRFKLAVAQNIEKIFKTLGYDDFKDFFDKILGIYMKDHNFSVRQQTVKCLVSLSSTFKAETELEVVSRFVNQLSSEMNYIYRCTSLMLLERAALGNAIDKKSLNDLFVGVTQKFSEKGEKIPNVLIYYFDMYAKIKSHLNSGSKKQYSAFLRKVQETITDEDVNFYIQKAQN